MFSGKITFPDALEIRNAHVTQFWPMKSQLKSWSGALENFVEEEAYLALVFAPVLFPLG